MHENDHWRRKVAVGFTYGILAVLFGIVVAYWGYTNDPFFIFVGIAWILMGIIALVYTPIYWLERKRERNIARAFRSKPEIYPTIICPSCKKKISEDYSQCPWCGTELKLRETGRHIDTRD